MKLLLVLVGLLLAMGVRQPVASAEWPTDERFRNSDIYQVCSPPADLRKSAEVYENLIARQLGYQLRDTRVEVRFVYSSGHSFYPLNYSSKGTDDFRISTDGYRLDISGRIGGALCTLPMTIRIFVRGYLLSGERVRMRTSALLQVTGVTSLRRRRE